LIYDNLDTATTKRCLESARKAAVQLQTATIDAHRILSRKNHLSGDSKRCLEMVWRHAMVVDDVLVHVADENGIKLVHPF
jgi:hypothetical protein